MLGYSSSRITIVSPYGLDLPQWLRWCTRHELRVVGARRAHIELFARSLEQDGKARATVARRLSTIAGFYRYGVEEYVVAVRREDLVVTGDQDPETPCRACETGVSEVIP